MKTHKIKLLNTIHKVFKLYDHQNQGNVDGFDCFWISIHKSLTIVTEVNEKLE